MTILSIARFVFIVAEVLFLFNLLIFVHELGHFLAAKWRGVFVEEFALWFGKPIWRKKIGGVWYALNSIPAGGYVKLPQMAPMEALEGESENLPPEARAPIKPLDKIIVAFAGPLFSFLLAVVFAIVVWQIGRPVRESERTTTVGYVLATGPAAKAGLQPGDVIKAVDGQPVNRWQGMASDSLVWRIITSEGETIAVTYLRDGKEATAQVKPEIPKTKAYERRATRQIEVLPAEAPLVEKVEAGKAAANAGLQKGDLILEANDRPIYLFENLPDLARAQPDQPLLLTVERAGQRVKLTAPLQFQGPVIENAFADGPAARAGLQKGDRIVRVNGKPVFASMHVIESVERDGDQPLSLEIERGGQPMKFEVVAELPVGETEKKLGLQFKADSLGLALNAYGRRSLDTPKPLEQIRLSAMSIVHTLSAILSPKSDVSAQHLGGPVMMMRIYYLLFESPDGWRQALWFSVLLNVNLALLNLIPLPVLDGGHITLAIFEAIRRRPIEGTFETRALQWVQTGAAMLLIGFMLFITFFDVQDLFGGRERRMKFAPKEQTK